MKLHEITSNINQFYNVIADTELDPEVIEDTLSSLMVELNEKVDAIAYVLRKLKAEQQFFKEEEERIKAKREVLANRETRLKRYLEEQLQLAGLDKVKTQLASVSFQNNPPSVYVEDETKIPEVYLLPQPPRIDKKSLLQALKDGVDIEGVSIRQEKSIRVR